jgi:hypothetical protein
LDDLIEHPSAEVRRWDERWQGGEVGDEVPPDFGFRPATGAAIQMGLDASCLPLGDLPIQPFLDPLVGEVPDSVSAVSHDPSAVRYGSGTTLRVS